MTDHERLADDERLLAELGEAIRAAGEVPAGFVAAGKAAFAWRTIDAELAALTHDSADAPGDAILAGTRADPAQLRSLTFVARELSIEIEVTADALLGQIVPPQPGRIELRGPDGSAHTVDIDDVGWFVITPVPRTMFRLYLRTEAGTSIHTEWITL